MESELLECALRETVSSSFVLNVSVWHNRARFGGGPLPGPSDAAGSGGETIGDAVLDCLSPLAVRLEDTSRPKKVRARANCRATFQRTTSR